MVNKAFEDLTGYTADELRQTDWAKTLTPPEWQAAEREELDELSPTGLPVRYEKEYLRKDGTRVPIELLVHLAADPAGNPLYYYSFITDITERRRAEAASARASSASAGNWRASFRPRATWATSNWPTSSTPRRSRR